jgi:hypothetical protein
MGRSSGVFSEVSPKLYLIRHKKHKVIVNFIKANSLGSPF